LAAKSTVAKAKKDGTSITSSTSSFNARVKDLKAYKEKYGHVNISRKTDKSLYDWCSTIRSKNKPSEGKIKLSQKRITSLDAIGFDWKMKADNSKKKRSFQNHVDDLKAYKARHGHLNVCRVIDKSLYQWCANMRSAPRNPEKHIITLTADRIAALDAIGFDWRSESQKISFQNRLEQLQAYRAQHGHINVKLTDNKSIHYFCKNMRDARMNPKKTQRKLTTERIAALDGIGFDWKIGTACVREKTISFHDRVKALGEYKKKYGHLSITQKDDKSLYDWCTNIRNARRGKLGMKLTTDGIAALDAIGFDWRLLNPILQPSGSPGDDADNAPAQNQRSSEKGDQIFQDHVEALRKYKKNNGHLNVSQDIDKSLFNWCKNIRSARNKPGEGKLKLTVARIAALDGIGFDWRSETKAHHCLSRISFIDRVEALRAYKDKHGHLSVSKEDEKSLFYWCSNIRSARRNPEKHIIKLTADQIAALDAIGFDWRSESCQKISFIDRVEALRAYKEKHGHLSISKKDEKSLFHWCSNIRNARNNPESCKRKVTAHQIAALDAIGFEWRLSKSDLQLSDSLGDDADNAFGKSKENYNTFQDCQCFGDGFHHDDLELVEIPNASVTFQEISIDSLTKEEKIMFDMIESSISAAE
jgi:hypothetical protein